MDTGDFLRMFAYDHWANRETLKAIGRGESSIASGTGSDGAVRRMGHILSAEKLWLERILKEAQSMAVWPSSTVEECLALADEMQASWRNYLTRLPAGGLGRES